MYTGMAEKYYAKKRRNMALFFSLIVHVIAIILTAVLVLKPKIEQIIENSIAVEFVEPQQHQRTQVPKRLVREVKRKQTTAGPAIRSAAAKLPTASRSAIPRVTDTPTLEAPPLPTAADLIPSPETILSPTDVNSPIIERGSGEIVGGDAVLGSGNSGKIVRQQSGGSGESLGNLTQSGGGGQGGLGEGIPETLGSYRDEIGDKLGSIIDEEDGIVRGHIRLIRLKHQMSDWWQDPTAIPSLIKWLRENARSITADMKYAGGALPLTDNRILDAPLVIMTGHDQTMSVSYQQLADRNSQASGFTDAERAALRKYILDYNGMLFFDYCGDGGNEKSFANLVETELRKVFPEYPMKTLDDIRHEIFQSYYKLKKTPVGGSAFWGTGYKGGNVKWRYIKGMLVPGRLGKPRLAVVFCPLDYLCSMETAEVDSRSPLASRRSSDVYRFMTNMFIYQMRQRAENQ
ncbi:DUF4159 domain-containing protein [Candidatus Poribacteria bacterium]|nr:DUF4159 domain-containing protein [Candidatus Poribacteria bacterium]MYG06555.1 DUF4159 domain-containing protein [Candidatus Poribacteria bacterium]MYK21820.1 DUF4159 domain-containing protein [Candidatus Poribacteria bacterium]